MLFRKSHEDERLLASERSAAYHSVTKQFASPAKLLVCAHHSTSPERIGRKRSALLVPLSSARHPACVARIESAEQSLAGREKTHSVVMDAGD